MLCVNLVDRTDAARVVDKAREADVPLVFFNREPVQEDIDAWVKVYYVGSDARQSAQLQAQIVLDLWESDPAALDRNGDGILQYMMLEGESRHQDAVIRTEVSVQTLREAGVPLERVESGIANWDRNQAAALTESALLEYPEIELILCNNDDMALGAIEALKAEGYNSGDESKYIPVVGVDATAPALEAMKDGSLLGTVLNDSTSQGNASVNIAVAAAQGKEITEENIGYPVTDDKYVWVDYVKVTQDNYQDYMS